MADSPGRVISSLSGGDDQLPPRVVGCVGVLMHLFDWNSRLPGRKFFSPRLLFPGRLQSSKRKDYSGKYPMAKLLLITEENCGGLSSSEEVSENFDSTISKVYQLAEGGGGKRTPGVIARLMGLESLPAKEPLGDCHVRFQSHNSDDAQERAPLDAESTSSEEFMEDCDSTVESINGQTPEECELTLQVATTERLREKQFIEEDPNGCTDSQGYTNVHPSITNLELGADSKLLMCSKLLSPSGTILSCPCVFPHSGHQQPLISHSKRPLISHLKKPNQNSNPNSEGAAKGPDGKFYGNRLGSAFLTATKEIWSPSLENKSHDLEKKGLKCSDNLEIQLERTDCNISISKPGFSTEAGNQVEEISADEKRIEESQDTQCSKEPWCGKLQSAAIGSPKCDVNSNKTTSTRCYKKKLELDAQVECGSDNLLKGRNAREWNGQAFEAQSINGIYSNDDVESVDMELEAAVPLPFQFDSKNADSAVKNSAQLPSPSAIVHQKEVHPAEILQKEVISSPLLENSYVHTKMVSEGTSKKPNFIHPEPARSIRSMKNATIESKQLPCRSARPLQLLDIEKKDLMHEGPHAMETNDTQDTRLKQNNAIIHKKSRPLKSSDTTSKRSVKPSLISKHPTQSYSIRPIPAGFRGENKACEFREEVNNRSKQDQNKFLKQPKPNYDSISNRTVPRTPQIGNKGNRPQNLSSISESCSNSGLAHTDKQSKLSDTSNYQSQKLSRKIKRLAHQPTTDNLACKLRAANSSGTLEVKACLRDSYNTATRVKTLDQFDYELKGPEPGSHHRTCLIGLSKEGCDCIHHKYMVENYALEPVLQENKIKVVREAHRFPTPLLKDVLKANSRRLFAEFEEIEKLPDKYTESAVNDEQLKTVLQHTTGIQVKNQVALGISTAVNNRDPAPLFTNPITPVTRKKTRAGTFRHMIDGGPQNECSNGFSSNALNFSEKQDGRWWEGDYSSSLQCNNFRFALHEDFTSPPSAKTQQQRMSVDPADICETMSDSTCTEDSEQPSPVSVIDSYFQKKLLLRLQKDYQRQLQESHMKRIETSSARSTSELFKEDKYNDIFHIDGIQNEQIMEAIFLASESDCCSICLLRLIENAEKMDAHVIEHYVKRVLIAPGSRLENKKWPLQCSSEGLMNNPELFKKLANRQHNHGAIKSPDCNLPEDATYALRLHHQRCVKIRTHYRLLFDCVNEALHLSLSDAMFSDGQIHEPHLNSKLPGEQILDQICKHMSGWQNLSLEAVDRVVDIEMSGTDKDWRNFRQELADIAMIMEYMVFRDVIEEVLLDFLGLKK